MTRLPGDKTLGLERKRCPSEQPPGPWSQAPASRPHCLVSCYDGDSGSQAFQSDVSKLSPSPLLSNHYRGPPLTRTARAPARALTPPVGVASGNAARLTWPPLPPTALLPREHLPGCLGAGGRGAALPRGASPATPGRWEERLPPAVKSRLQPSSSIGPTFQLYFVICTISWLKSPPLEER